MHYTAIVRVSMCNYTCLECTNQSMSLLYTPFSSPAHTHFNTLTQLYLPLLKKNDFEGVALNLTLNKIQIFKC